MIILLLFDLKKKHIHKHALLSPVTLSQFFLLFQTIEIQVDWMRLIISQQMIDVKKIISL